MCQYANIQMRQCANVNIIMKDVVIDTYTH